jgi:PemK-like, MazF-like toxin of type II toxin-antitoxin system
VANLLKTFFRRMTAGFTIKSAAPPPSPAPRHPARVKPQPPSSQPPSSQPPSSQPSSSRGRRLEYSPNLDGDADPGEIVWTWVPYEEDPNRGKDRPVLVVGRDGRTVLGLMLSSRSERDGQHNWLALGPGDWDAEGRPSWIRLDRVIEVDHDGIRREGAVLDRSRFERVAGQLRQEYGWA